MSIFLFKPYSGSRIIDMRLPKDWVCAEAATLGDWILAEDAAVLEWPYSQAAKKAVIEMLPFAGGVLYDARHSLRIITPRVALYDVWALLNTLDPPQKPNYRQWYELNLYRLAVNNDYSFRLEPTPREEYLENLPPLPYNMKGEKTFADQTKGRLALLYPKDAKPGECALLALCDDDGDHRRVIASLRCKREVHITYYVHPQTIIAVRNINVSTIREDYAL